MAILRHMAYKTCARLTIRVEWVVTMIGYRSMLLGMTCGLALASPLVLGCEPDAQRTPIMVTVSDSGMPAVSQDTVTACEGEEIRWVFRGPAAREFAIIFMNDAESPFEGWSQRRGATVTGRIKHGALKGQAETPYKYDVEVDGQRLDPRIIVVP
jgi:hypothetical protein